MSFRVSCQSCHAVLYKGDFPENLQTLVSNDLHGKCPCGHVLDLKQAKVYANGQFIENESKPNRKLKTEKINPYVYKKPSEKELRHEKGEHTWRYLTKDTWKCEVCEATKTTKEIEQETQQK